VEAIAGLFTSCTTGWGSGTISGSGEGAGGTGAGGGAVTAGAGGGRTGGGPGGGTSIWGGTDTGFGARGAGAGLGAAGPGAGVTEAGVPTSGAGGAGDAKPLQVTARPFIPSPVTTRGSSGGTEVLGLASAPNSTTATVK
jgi:hypothetical protein